MSAPHLAMPWAPGSRGYCLPGSVLVKMALGEAPDAIPASVDVRNGRMPAALSMDGGPFDRITRRLAGVMRLERVHAAAAGIKEPGARHRGFNESEQVLGLARTFRLQVPPHTPIGDLIDALSQITSVEAATPNLLCMTPFALGEPSGPAEDWAPWQAIRAPEAMAYENGDAAVIVAIIDSGVAPGHPELSGRLRAGMDTVQLGQSDVALGLQLLGDRSHVDNDPTDRFVGHGMGCAGIVGALGLGMPPGLAGAAQMLPLRGLGAARFPGKSQAVGLGAVADLDMALKLAVDLGAKVISMSFGTGDDMLEPGAPKPHSDTVAYALQHGCILVAASGNSGTTTRYWPAAFPGVIAVGSVGTTAVPSVFSTRGDHIALCAPGERIFTLGLEGYQSVTGTSFAAPFVSAAAALLVARAGRRSTVLDGAVARRVLMASAAPFAESRAGCGAGVLDVYGALRALDAYIDETLPGDPAQIEDG